MDLRNTILAMGEKALTASRRLALLKASEKNKILKAMADEIEKRRERIKAANSEDMKAGRAAGLSSAMLDRLELTDRSVSGMVDSLREVAALKDPVGRILRRWRRPNGLNIKKLSVPIGVIAIIYESRPNVTAEASGLCFKASNAVILRGGKEALASNKAIVEALRAGGSRAGLPENAIQLVETTDRAAVRELVQLEGLVDLVMPRGGEALIRAVAELARVPVIKHYKGVCHVYVDESAQTRMALSIIENAKCQRPGVCNAAETLLVHEKIAKQFLPRAARALMKRGVELRGDEAARSLVPSMKPASEEDWSAEYLDLTLAVRVAPSVEAAIEHINKYGSHHSDAIITESKEAAAAFSEGVDSAAVYINATTRFTDGGEFGMGAEIGISTDKLHARGPMGLEELTTYKYIVSGAGQIRK